MEEQKATPHEKLIDRLMDSRHSHTEVEHAARREIEDLRQQLLTPHPSGFYVVIPTGDGGKVECEVPRDVYNYIQRVRGERESIPRAAPISIGEQPTKGPWGTTTYNRGLSSDGSLSVSLTEKREEVPGLLLPESRYSIKTGRFGAYFHDKQKNHDLTLPEVCSLLNVFCS